MDKKQEQKQIAIRMNKDEIMDLKQYCLDNDTTITDAIKSGIKLLKAQKAAQPATR
jgi:hypothetical protein